MAFRYTARRLAGDRRVYARRTGRARYGRRRGYVSTGAVGRTHFNACAAVYMNPFSTATTNPKILDNKVYASTGIRLQAVTEITNDATGTVDILLFPGLGNGVVVQSSLEAGATGTCMPYQAHGRWSESGFPKTMIGAPIHKWRIVSQAMKLTLVNNSDENDGWFEAIRVQGSADSDFQNVVQASAGEGSFIGQTNGTLPAAGSNAQMVEHPTYCTGKLRDIHRYMFHLMPQGNDHEFNILPRSCENAEEFCNANIDNESYDMVFIRIHGRAGALPTRLMAHVVCNQEVVYDEASFMTRYHSESKGSAAAHENVKKRKRDHTPISAALTVRSRLTRSLW